MLTRRSVFLATQVHILEFVVSLNIIFAGLKKVRAIEEWPELRTIREVISFHGLATFYRQFIKWFNTVMTLITDCLKKGEFAWSNAAAKAFVKIKIRIISAHLASP